MTNQVRTSGLNVRPSLQLDGVAKTFENVQALHNIWLKVERGEFLTLLGPSGCGKSTILNLIAGFLDCDAGEIFIEGEVVTAVPTYQREIGIVFQNYALFPHMSVRRNVGYGLEMRGVDKAEREQRVELALDLVKLTGLGDRRPKQLSGGQQQRVALARALVVEPKVLLLDEPFSALDKSLRSSMQVELKDIQRKTGVTTVFVTHDQGEALSMSDRIVVMSEGCIRQIGTPHDVYRNPADRFVATFIGDATSFGANVGKADEIGVTLLVGDHPIVLDHNGRSLELGQGAELFVRPEAIDFVQPGSESGLRAIVGNVIYQGGHIDVHLDCPQALGGRVLVRLSGSAPVAPHIGEVVQVRLNAAGASAFPLTAG